MREDVTELVEDSAAIPGVIAQSSLMRLPYVRLLVATAEPANLTALRRTHDYVFAYSYADVGAIPGFGITRKKTALIDLTSPADEILKTFRSNTRNEIRKTFRGNALQIVADDPMTDASVAFYCDAKRQAGVRPDVQGDFSSCRFFNAYVDNQLVASVSCYDSGVFLRLKHIVSSRKLEGIDARQIGYATRRLVWEICLYGKSRGYEHLDLGGIDLEDEEKRGVAMFKQSFQGDVVDVVVYRSSSSLFRLAQRTTTLLGR